MSAVLCHGIRLLFAGTAVMSRRQAVNTIPACPPDEGLLMRGSWLIESATELWCHNAH